MTTSESKRHKRDGKGFRKFLVTNENNEIRRGAKREHQFASFSVYLSAGFVWTSKWTSNGLDLRPFSLLESQISSKVSNYTDIVKAVKAVKAQSQCGNSH